MDKNAARRILWIRAIDECDEERLVLTGPVLAKAAETPDDAELAPAERQAKHATRLFDVIAQEQPELAELDARFHWPLWLSPAVLLAAFIAGVAADTMASSGRIDIIAFPLLGLFLWNLAVYAFLVVRWIVAKKRKLPASPSGASAWFPKKLFAILPWPDFPKDEKKAKRADVWRAAGRAFAAPWLKLERPLFHERLRILLHGAAVAAVAGMAVNMYLKGLNFEYRAGWGSTFLEPEDLRRWLGIVFGPASSLIGVPLPDAAELATLRWSTNPDGEIAGRWIHLYAATAALVVAPRLILIGASAWRGWQAGRAVELEGLGKPLLRFREPAPVAPESVAKLCVIPYNHTCAPVFRDRLRGAVSARREDRFHLDYLDRVNYGLEAEYAAGLDLDRLKCAALLVVFNLSSTPEDEVQGLFLDRLEQMTRRSERHADIEVWLDESAFSERFRRDAGYDERLKQRRAAWARLLAKRDLEPQFIDVVTAEFLRPQKTQPRNTQSTQK